MGDENRESGTSRRRFLGGSLAAAAPVSSGGFLAEHGFWDYTTPGAGGMEAFQWDDYQALLDDMAKWHMNSLMIYVKWLTTGYRSRLPFQDQLPGNPVIASDNELLRRVIAEAGKLGIQVWLGAAVTYFDIAKFGPEPPYRTIDAMSGFGLPIKVGLYHTDTPGLTERIVQIYEELLELFPGISGLNVELEGAGVETPGRIAAYNRWAREQGRVPFERLGHPLDPRTFDAPEWRDYTTHSRLRVLREVQDSVRRRGFRGSLAMICETGRSRYAIGQEVNLEEFHKRFPDWIAITYEYDKWTHRYGMMDVCMDLPKKLGLKVYYLPRGVMTWGARWPLPLTLEQSWQFDVEDIQRFRPEGVWWFGCGTANEGAHVSAKRLRQSGYQDSAEARRALLQTAAGLR